MHLGLTPFPRRNPRRDSSQAPQRHTREPTYRCFPPDLAARRYRHWIRNACTSASPRERVYVVGKTGGVKGFFQVRLAEDKDRAEIGIMGVAAGYFPARRAAAVDPAETLRYE